MNFNIEKAIKYTFEDDNWIKRIGIVIVLTTIIQFFMQLTDVSTDLLSNAALYSEDIASTSNLMSVMQLGGMSLYLLIALASVPFNIYLLGYRIRTRLNVMKHGGDNSNVNLTPTHTDIVGTFRIAGEYIVISIIPFIIQSLITALTLLPVGFLIISALFTDQQEILWITLLSITLFGLGVIFVIIISILIQYIYIPASYYLYVTNGNNFSQALNPAEVMRVAKANFKNFGLVGLLGYALGIAAAMITLLLTCMCIGFFVGPALGVVVGFAYEYLIGTVYADIARKTA